MDERGFPRRYINDDANSAALTLDIRRDSFAVASGWLGEKKLFNLSHKRPLGVNLTVAWRARPDKLLRSLQGIPDVRYWTSSGLSGCLPTFHMPKQQTIMTHFLLGPRYAPQVIGWLRGILNSKSISFDISWAF
jgi:hypothetical protein